MDLRSDVDVRCLLFSCNRKINSSNVFCKIHWGNLKPKTREAFCINFQTKDSNALQKLVSFSIHYLSTREEMSVSKKFRRIKPIY